MLGVYPQITDASPAMLDCLRTVLDRRAADPQQRAMLHTSLTDTAIPQGGRMLAVGCGNGGGATGL
jgi:hypothetical protein